MASTYLDLSQNSINSIVRGIKALDNNKFVTKSLFIRNISIRILLLTYIVHAFFYESPILLGGLILFGTAYFLTQLYVFNTLLLTAGYGLSDWKLLFKQQSKISKFFILAGTLLIPLLTIELVFLTENIIETVLLIPLLFAFITNSLTDVLVSPYIRYKMENRYQKSQEQKVLTEMNPEVKEAEYKQLAISILTDKSSKGEVMSEGNTSPVSEKQQAQFSQLREQALQKLEDMGQETKSPYALSPEAIDVLTPEEIEALFAGEDAPRKTRSHQYSWESEDHSQ